MYILHFNTTYPQFPMETPLKFMVLLFSPSPFQTWHILKSWYQISKLFENFKSAWKYVLKNYVSDFWSIIFLFLWPIYSKFGSLSFKLTIYFEDYFFCHNFLNIWLYRLNRADRQLSLPYSLNIRKLWHFCLSFI